MDLLEAIVLAIVQGATEFLPVSSSAHLVLVPWWLNWDKSPLMFDAVVHLGTLLAVLIYFWRDWLTLVRASLHALRIDTLPNFNQDPDARLVYLIGIGTLPAAVLGLLLQSTFESAFGKPMLVAGFLLITATLLVLSERLYAADRTLEDLNTRDALIVGLAQAVAIFPGISRSGSTIVAGIVRGLPRAVAARYSFLLSIPIIVLAGAKQTLDVLTGSESMGQDMILPLLIGFLVSGITGYVCIWSFMRLLQQRRLYGFAIYCAAFGTVSLLVALLT